MKTTMSTALFILFEEYSDAGKAPSQIYISAKDKIDSDALLCQFNEWMKIVEFFKYEKCNKYYDKENIKGILYPYKELAKEYAEQTDEYPDAAFYMLDKFNTLGIIDWQEECNETTSETYTYIEWDVTNDLLGEIARRQENSIPCILLNCNAIKEANPMVLSASSRRIINITHTKEIGQLYKWFCKNRMPQRVFVYNPKHGDDKHTAQLISGTSRQAAQLEISCPKAQELLELAIGNDANSALWIYDKSTKKYIYFENQREERLAFHGYHLQEGEENYENINRDKIRSIQNDAP